MVHLTLVGLSEDRTRLLLVDDSGTEFTLDVDTMLRAAVRGEHARLGQLEIEMDSALRPRDIQARIRAGETPDAVAAAARTTVEKIMPYAAPVLAEREHIAERAQRSSVRRKAGEVADVSGSPARSRTLGDAVAGHLRSINVPPAIVAWDAYRREDGRWALTGAFSTDQRTGSALYAYDAPGNFVVSENDDARWLIGELSRAPVADQPAGPRRPGTGRRLSAVPSDELPLGDDAIEMVSDDDEPAAPDHRADLTDTAVQVRVVETPTRPKPPSADEPSFFDAVFAEEEQPTPAAAPAASAQPEADPAEDEPPARRPTRKKGARASVPSWDEIMFGGGKND